MCVCVCVCVTLACLMKPEKLHSSLILYSIFQHIQA